MEFGPRNAYLRFLGRGLSSTCGVSSFGCVEFGELVSVSNFSRVKLAVDEIGGFSSKRAAQEESSELVFSKVAP